MDAFDIIAILIAVTPLLMLTGAHAADHLQGTRETRTPCIAPAAYVKRERRPLPVSSRFVTPGVPRVPATTPAPWEHRG